MSWPRSVLLSVSIFLTIENTLSLYALLFGRDSSGNTTAHKVPTRGVKLALAAGAAMLPRGESHRIFLLQQR